MEQVTLNSTLPRFVEHVAQQRLTPDRALTVCDLRVGIRNIRMSEFIDWSNSDLDAIEAHAARFTDDAPLESVLSIPTEAEQGECVGATSSFCSPSPFAWM